MPPENTICISLGNWILAFYFGYLIAGIAVLSAVGLVTDQTVRAIRRRRPMGKRKLTPALD